jgi:leucyl aminopeptidase
MATISTTSQSLLTVTADAVAVAVAKTGDGPRPLLPESLPAPLDALLGDTGALTALGVTGKAEEIVRVPTLGAMKAPVLVLVGIGREELATTSDEELRQAAGAATRALAGTATVAFSVPSRDVGQVAAVASGALLGAYSFAEAKGAEADLTAPVRDVVLVVDKKTAAAAADLVTAAGIEADAVKAARDLVNTPPNQLFPDSFAVRAREAVKKLPVDIDVLDEVRLAEGGYGGITGVGQGSRRPPRLVVLRYAPQKADKHLALVGKGITFDSGGLSLKQPKGMDEMTSDMAGAASVLATVTAAARLEIPVRVTAFLALAENLPGGGAQRPGDIVTMRNGKTVAITNTDAEGRMVMGDALVDACAEKPDLVVDIATLTGAQEVALGMRTGAVMGTSAGREAIVSAADDTGEQFWPMPFPSELRAELDHPLADLRNAAYGKGGMLSAGIFLREFVDTEQVEWAHLDVAGPAYLPSGPFGYTHVGGTGMGVRTLLELARDLAD